MSTYTNTLLLRRVSHHQGSVVCILLGTAKGVAAAAATGGVPLTPGKEDGASDAVGAGAAILEEKVVDIRACCSKPASRIRMAMSGSMVLAWQQGLLTA